MLRLSLALALMIAAFSTTARAAHHEDEAAVREAVMNYVNAFYQAKPELGEASVATDLAKRGYARRSVEDPYSGPFFMTFDQLLEMSADWAEGEDIGPDTPKEITIFEISDVTASVKIEALWGFDYMHLAKIEGTWKIVNVLWQTYPDLNAGGETSD